MSFPYRVNIYLSWEGAYRMSEGQMPFRDFGMPMGYMYWVVPTLFFKLFGPQMITLVKAQVLINIIGVLAFRSILKSFNVLPLIRFAAIFYFLVSYTMINFWPWYNHTVIVYELVALAFLCRFLMGGRKWYWLIGAAFFSFASFFTKQDGGAMAILFCIALLTYDAVMEKEWKPLAAYLGMLAATACIMVMPLLQYEFLYWFNLGQEPHTARISVSEFMHDLVLHDDTIKFSLMLVVVIGMIHCYYDRALFRRRDRVFFLLFTLGILVQAAVLQVTSYTPPNNNIYFQSFVFTYILTTLAHFFPEFWRKPAPVLVVICLIFVWRSEVYGSYLQRILGSPSSNAIVTSASGENRVNRSNYLRELGPTGIPEHLWKETPYPVFNRIRMPEQTVDGIKRLLALPELQKKDPQVLNMTELTPLAAVVPFKPETGTDIPLWYHLGVGMFNREARMFEERIAAKYYDVVLFEYIPVLNNFYPFRVRDSLSRHYRKIDSFAAPRRGVDTTCKVEVYVR